jgi:hypothetical protein
VDGGAGLLDKVGELDEAPHDVLAAVANDNVIIAGYNDNIHGSGMDLLNIVQPESVGKSVNCRTWDRDVVAVHHVPLILEGGSVAGGGRRTGEGCCQRQRP